MTDRPKIDPESPDLTAEGPEPASDRRSSEQDRRASRTDRRQDDQTAPSPELISAIETALSGPESGREELRDFFRALGTGVRRRYRKTVPLAVRRRTTRLAVFAIVGSVALLVWQGWSSRPPLEIPIELQANWVTTAKGYADREFWIGKHQVAFRVGPTREDINVYNVTHVDQKSVRGDTIIYDIDYAVDGGTGRLSVRHAQWPQPNVVFVHQPQMTWTVKPDLHPPVR